MTWNLTRIASVIACVVAAAAAATSVKCFFLIRAAEQSRSDAVDYAQGVEAKVAVTELAWGLAVCAERTGELPPSSSAVPPAIKAIRGRQYQSAFTDWNDVAFRCADFHLARPQLFQYRWDLKEQGKEGEVVACADYNGDNVIDHEVRLPVRCAAVDGRPRCRPDAMPLLMGMREPPHRGAAAH